MVESFGVEAGGVGGGVVEIAGDDGGAADTEFARGVVGGYFFAGVIDDSVGRKEVRRGKALTL